MPSLKYKDSNGNWVKVGLGRGVSSINGQYGDVTVGAEDLSITDETAAALGLESGTSVDDALRSIENTYTVSVPLSWTENSAGGYMQTISVSGILETDNPIADVILGADIEANALYLEAWALVTRITTDDSYITLYANSDAPTTAFTIQLKAVR